MNTADLAPSPLEAPRKTEVENAARGLQDFLNSHHLPHTPEGFVLYVTWLATHPGRTGVQLRRELRLLDLAEALAGRSPWSRYPEIITLLAGIHHEQPLGHSGPRCDPLYREHVHALVDATMQPTIDQRRLHTAALLTLSTPLSAAAIARLRWADVHLTTQQATITHNLRTGRGPHSTRIHRIPRTNQDPDLDLVGVLHRLRSHDPSTALVCSTRGGRFDEGRIQTATGPLRRLLHHGEDPATVAAIREVIRGLLSPTPGQLRDRALLLVGFGAALRTHEAAILPQGKVRTTPRGLLIHVPGRGAPTGIPDSNDPQYDASTAWNTWTAALGAQQQTGSEQPAFPQISFSIIRSEPLHAMGLNYLIQQRAAQAHLGGNFTFTSLRSGFIRDARRADAQAHRVAKHADLTCLGSVERHDRRERLLSHNVVSMLGL